MRFRRFSAPTKAEALRQVRAALGEQALVLSTHVEPDGSVVITTAVDVEEQEAAPLDRRQGGAAERLDLALIRTQLEQLGREVRRVARVLDELEGTDGRLGAEAREVASRLLASGVARHLAEPVAQRFEREVQRAASPGEALHASLLAYLPVCAPPDAPLLAFVGPTGAGKTTTIAKLAAHRVAAGETPPGLVVADNRRVGAVEQLAAFARLLGAPLRTARDPEEMVDAVAALRGPAPVLIDTSGLGGDTAACAEVQALLGAAGEDLHVTAVVSATASARALERAWPQLAQLRPASAVVSKLDDCDGPGTACTWLAEVGLSVAWLGTGQRIPDDLVEASGERLARWLVAA